MMNTISTNEPYKEDLSFAYDFPTNEDNFSITPPRKLSIFRETIPAYTNVNKIPALPVAAVRKITQLEIALAQEKKRNEEMKCELHNQKFMLSQTSATSPNKMFSQTRYNEEKALAVHLTETQAAFERAKMEIENLKNNIEFVRLSAASEINEVHKNLKIKCQQLQELEDEVIILRDMLKKDYAAGVISIKSLLSKRPEYSTASINPISFSVERSINIFIKGTLEQNVHYENTVSCGNGKQNFAYSSEKSKGMQLDYQNQLKDIKVKHTKQLEAIKHDYEKQLEEMKIDHIKQLEKNHSSYKKELEAIKHDYEKQLEEIKFQLHQIKQKLGQRETDMHKIETQLKRACTALNEHETMLGNRSKEILTLQTKLNEKEKAEASLKQIEEKLNCIKQEERDLQNERSTLIRERQELEKKHREILDERQDILIQANELDSARKRVLSHMVVYGQCFKQFLKVHSVRVELFNEQQENQLQERLETSIGVQNALKRQLSIAQKLVSKRKLDFSEEEAEEQGLRSLNVKHPEKRLVSSIDDSSDFFLKPQPVNQHYHAFAQNNEQHKSRFQLYDSPNKSTIHENRVLPYTNMSTSKKAEHPNEKKKREDADKSIR